MADSAADRSLPFGLLALQNRLIDQVRLVAAFQAWTRDKGRELAEQFVQLGFRAVTVCVDPRVLDDSFPGRELDSSFFADLPPGVDPCGENGEFHTFVFDGPIFKTPIAFRTGEKVLRDGFCFCDLLPK